MAQLRPSCQAAGVVVDSNAVFPSSEKCTCGYQIARDEHRSITDQPDLKTTNCNELVESFVHLPRYVIESPIPKRALGSCQQSGLENQLLLMELEKACRNPLDPPRLCYGCMKRVEKAMRGDIGRIDRETLVYDEASKAEGLYIHNLELAFRAVNYNEQDGDMSSFEPFSQSVYRQRYLLQVEIASLKEACQNHEEERYRLLSLLLEQAKADEQLDELAWALEQERNDLELQARAFDSQQEALIRSFTMGSEEVNMLYSSHVKLLPLLFRLQVDQERGLRYPLINGLRLAYRPKGDVTRDEIQAAWSLAAQLFLAVGSLFHFQSVEWKIVPLSQCAKLVRCRRSEQCDSGQVERYHRNALALGGVNMENQSLLIWNDLLHQLVRHVIVHMHEAGETGFLYGRLPTLPCEISSEKIGRVDLTYLDRNDDLGWSRMIHYTACTLQWLSDCSQALMLQNVRFLADVNSLK